MTVPAPVASYKLSNTTDDMATYTLTNNGVVTFVAGLVGNCANCVRASSQYLSNASNLGITTGNISLMAWINVAALPTSAGDIWGIVNKGDATSNIQYSLYLYNEGGTQKVVFNRQIQSVRNDELKYTASLSTSAWHHIVGTYDGTNSRLYVDGALVAGPTAFSGTGGSAGVSVLQVGRSESRLSGSYFNGKIDIAAVWNTVLSAADVTDLYSSGAGLEYPFTITTSNSAFLGAGI